jgi:putative MATE family efflux protein
MTWNTGSSWRGKGNLENSLLYLKKEKIYVDLWRLAWPVMISMVLHTALGLVDMYWVGKLGITAVASLSLAGNLFFMFINFAEIISIGTIALVARQWGAGEREESLKVVHHSFWLGLGISLFFAGLLLLQGSALVHLFRVEEALHRQATGYLRITGIGYIFIYTSMAFSSALQGAGDTRTPMLVLFLGNALNMALDPVLIFGWFGLPALGVLGAGLATLLSQVVMFLLLLYILLTARFSPTGLKLQGLLRLSFQPLLLKKILQVGVPAALQATTRPLTGMVMMWLVALFGTEAVAAFGIGQRVLGFAFIMLVGLMVATSTMVGQSLGAGHGDLAREVARRGLLVGFFIQVAFSSLYFVFAAEIMRFFGATGGALAAGISYLQIISLALLLGGPLFVLGGVFKGAGDTVPPMVSSLLANWVVKIPGAYILALPLGLGYDGVWWAISISIVAEVIFLAYYYRQGLWALREVRVERERQP